MASQGDDRTLTKLIEPLSIAGTYHALSVAVLGSYIGNFADGDPAKAPQFLLDEAKEGDVKARKLDRILREYADALEPAERDLLSRLALFPRGVKIEYLGWIIEAGGTVAGALIGQSSAALVRQLSRLEKLGLVFHYQTGTEAVYSAHPFLRDFFRSVLSGVRAENIHESIRAKLAPSLESRPSEKPSDPGVLDQYEFLIEQSLAAGHIQEACDLYWGGLGASTYNLENLGENTRGLRILERFFPADDFTNSFPALSTRDRSRLACDLGLFSRSLSDLARANSAFLYCAQLDTQASDARNESQDEENLSSVAQLAGRCADAATHADRAFELADLADEPDRKIGSLCTRAYTRFVLGETALAEDDFLAATELPGKAMSGYYSAQRCECDLALGRVSSALVETRRSLAVARTHNACLFNALLARLLVNTDTTMATGHLIAARQFAEKSGEIELQLRCFQAACELALAVADLPQSLIEGEAGILLADTCGFGKFSVDIRVPLAGAYLASNQYQKALQTARYALDLSEQGQYAWGQADALHLCGIAHIRLGESELARQRLTAALALRTKLTHPKTDETKRALDQLSGSGRAAGTKQKDSLPSGASPY